MTGIEVLSRHVPVLLEEVLEGLALRQGGVYLDGTIGWGGHTSRILQMYEDTRVIGLDRDAAALEAVSRKLANFGDRVLLFHSDFRELDKVLDEAGVGLVDGILMDLGVSSMQLEDANRGFSFAQDGPLDMRMDPDSGVAAAEIVNTWAQTDLANLFFKYGEEKRSRAIAAAIVRTREASPIENTLQLADLISSVPGMGKVRNIHPATRTFQALRIEVNDELDAVRQVIPAGVERLTPGGRLAIISFHSLEDRIVKRSFRELESPCRCPKEFPECRCGKVSAGKVLTRRPVVPSEKEIMVNPRSRSAKLRVFEKGSTQDAERRTQNGN
ncbi:MAG: 16S rRNA (cytosine(1402)-N(4))-methyltransferase RsmH [bacterium]|nr:16S rRNA (cytosine(1402)-N(4))-methyltransferase RsmH [bacterium]MDT8365030.1 16S rRNA (cytosine(1402)-N(4))-methyltransferase RsmH [bacterium]